jgi:NNP family nitrate/nitrite transporter-like MFS transporter
VTGIVGAGGNVGAVCFGFAFHQLSYKDAFTIMGGSILISSVLSVAIHIKGHAGMFWGQDRGINKETGELAKENSVSSPCV